MVGGLTETSMWLWREVAWHSPSTQVIRRSGMPSSEAKAVLFRDRVNQIGDMRILMDINQNESMDRAPCLVSNTPSLSPPLPHVDPFLSTEPRESFL